jgi:hypothetical protein
MKMKTKTFFRFAVISAALLAFALMSCTSSGQEAGTEVVMSGTMTKGSTIINGVRFDDVSASISADEAPLTAGELEDGMVIKLKGTMDDGGATGTALIIEVENELRGTISAISGDSFEVEGHSVYVDGATVFANTVDLSGLVANVDSVEVHGQRNSSGAIRATRVEKLSASLEDEVRGIVTGKTGTTSGTFSIQGSSRIYNYDGTTVIVDATSFGNGDLVEVHLSGSDATRIELEDAEDTEFEFTEHFEIEAFISGYSSHPGVFSVGLRQVQTASTTRFDGGTAADLGNDVRVEAEGMLSGGILYADKISFEETMKLEGNAGSAGSADLLDLSVVVTSRTEYSDLPSGLASILSGDGLRVRGFLNPDGITVTATRIDRLSNPVDADKQILQGVVTSQSAPSSLVIAGITVDVTGVSSVEIDEVPASVTEFFTELEVDRSVVKARGTYTAGTLTADEVSIE